MKWEIKMRVFKNYVLMIFSVIFVTFQIAQPQTCPNNLVIGDRDIWNSYSYMSEQWYRNMIANFYNLQKDDWDEGWGWAKYNNPDPDRFEFCKMMSAGKLLFSGLADALFLQGAWSARTILTTTSDPNPEIRAISRAENSIDLFYRNNNSKLIHLRMDGSPWDSGNFPPASTATNISDLLATEKEEFRFENNPSILTRSESYVDVLVRNSKNELIHFSWNQTDGWSAINATMSTVRSIPIGTIDRYFIYKQPVCVSRETDAIDVFALDNFNHLIHYYWYAGVGWAAEDITQVVGDDYKIVSDPVIYRKSFNELEVFGRSSYGYLIHFQWSEDNGWSAENISEIVGTSKRIQGNPAVVSPHWEYLMVYARSNYDILLYVWTSLFGWIELELTDTDFAIEGDPVVVRRSMHHVDAFASDINGHLIHFYFNPDMGIGAEDLTLRLSGYRISEALTVTTLNSNRIDVFSGNLFGYLTHYYWTSQLGWRTESVHLSPGVSANFHKIGTRPIVVQRNESTLDVFGGRQSSSTHSVHYTAAVGLTVNSWHTNEDYYNWASGSNHDFKYEPENSNDARASAFGGALQTDRVEMKCPIFNATPASRAGTMLHEATHMIFWRFRHQSNQSTSTCSDPCSDDWYFHGVRNPEGNLNADDKNHSMNQIQIEYLTDIAEFSRFDIPGSAYTGALLEATSRMNNRILNPPAWVPGTPRPLR